jgi:Undecaprenyl-phosphate glucose phosphotransferase
MMRERLKRAQFAFNLVVLFTPLAAFAIAGYLRFATHWLPRYSSDVDPSPYFGLLVLTTIVWAIAVDHYELASIENHLQATGRIRRALAACIATYVAILAITFFYRGGTTFSRLFIWSSGLGLLCFSLLAQAILHWARARARSRYDTGAKVLIVGADEFARRVAESLLSESVAPCTIAGFVKLAGQMVAANNAPTWELGDVETLAIGNAVDDVVLAVPPTLLGELSKIRRQLSALCVPVRLVLDVGEPIDSSQRIFSVGDLLMMDLQDTPAESVLYITLKRAFDLAFSAAVLILTAPVFVFIAFAVRLTSPGPIFFTQERVGLNGKLFGMVKFRTMTVAPRTDSDTRWTVRNDPRCTRIGRLLRKTGLDELPQFFNVLKGDMSVVGPRPERPLLVQRFMQSVGNYNRRHYLKVGITGWAQVNGWRGDTSIEKRIEYDLYYMRHWTLTFDLLIVVLTFLRGFTDKNAY